MGIGLKSIKITVTTMTMKMLAEAVKHRMTIHGPIEASKPHLVVMLFGNRNGKTTTFLLAIQELSMGVTKGQLASTSTLALIHSTQTHN